MMPSVQALRLAMRLFSTGSISRGVRLPSLPSPSGGAPALEASQPQPPVAASAATTPGPAAGSGAAGSSSPSLPSQLLSDLERSGRIHKETLGLMEGSPEWQGYESQVNFDLNMLRLRYAATPDAPMTPARRAQLAAHLRAAQAKVMEEHATAAARKFVESLSPKEVDVLRDMVGRLDTPGVGAPLAAQEAAKRDSGYESFKVSAEKLKDALWDLSSALGGGGGESQGGGGGRGGGRGAGKP